MRVSPVRAIVVAVTPTDARIVSAVPVTLGDWQRSMLARLMHGPISGECQARIAGVLVATRPEVG